MVPIAVIMHFSLLELISFPDNLTILLSLNHFQLVTMLRGIAVECVDRMEQEFSNRFSSENTILWSSMESLLPSSVKYLDVNHLEPFFKYALQVPVIKQKLIVESLGKADFKTECRI